MTTNRIATLFPADGEQAFDQEFEVLRPTKRSLWPGCRVRVHSGAMAGVEGTVLAYSFASRLVIALDVNCRGVTLEIDEQKLTLLAH